MEKFKASWLLAAIYNRISTNSTKNFKSSKNFSIMLNIKFNSWNAR
jgi:hypothetical protein